MGDVAEDRGPMLATRSSPPLLLPPVASQNLSEPSFSPLLPLPQDTVFSSDLPGDLAIVQNRHLTLTSPLLQLRKSYPSFKEHLEYRLFPETFTDVPSSSLTLHPILHLL